MEGAKGWLNDLKIRASYGTQGNEGGIDSMSYVDQYSVSWDGSAHSLSYAYYANPDLTPSSSTQLKICSEDSSILFR